MNNKIFWVFFIWYELVHSSIKGKKMRDMVKSIDFYVISLWLRAT